jgi:hypothetical protein
MRRIKDVLLLGFVLCMVGNYSALSASSGQLPGCSKNLEFQALNRSPAKDWNELYRAFKQFSACDDGAIAEGFSDEIAQLLVKQWNRLNVLSRLVTADKNFEKFVIRHIDETLSLEESAAILNNAKSHCPSGEARVCNLIKTSLADAAAPGH